MHANALMMIGQTVCDMSRVNGMASFVFFWRDLPLKKAVLLQSVPSRGGM